MASKPDFNLIFPRKKSILVLGVFIAILNSLCLYFFYNIIIDSINFMFSLMDFEQWTQAMSIKPYYNLFIASISVVFGISVCFSFWAKTNRYYIRRGKLMNLQFLNEQRNVTWSFLFFFTELGFVLVIFYAGCFRASDYLYMAFQSYFWLFVFIPIGLFFQLWKPIIMVLRRKVYPIISLVFVVSILASFGLSKLDAVDFCSFDLNEGMILNDKLYEYQVHLPHQHNAKCITKESWCNHITYAVDSSNQEVLFYNKEKIEFKELKQKVLESLVQHPPSIKPYLSYVIDADSSFSDYQLEPIANYLFYNLGISNKRIFRGVHKSNQIGNPRKYSQHLRKLKFVPEKTPHEVRKQFENRGITNFQIRVPTAENLEMLNKKMWFVSIFFYRSPEQVEFILVGDELIKSEDLKSKIEQYKYSYQADIRNYVKFLIHADISISDKDLKPIVDIIVETGTIPSAVVRAVRNSNISVLELEPILGYRQFQF